MTNWFEWSGDEERAVAAFMAAFLLYLSLPRLF